eukprot:Rmarinus@m.3457
MSDSRASRRRNGSKLLIRRRKDEESGPSDSVRLSKNLDRHDSDGTSSTDLPYMHYEKLRQLLEDMHRVQEAERAAIHDALALLQQETQDLGRRVYMLESRLPYDPVGSSYVLGVPQAASSASVSDASAAPQLATLADGTTVFISPNGSVMQPQQAGLYPRNPIAMNMMHSGAVVHSSPHASASEAIPSPTSEATTATSTHPSTSSAPPTNPSPTVGYFPAGGGSPRPSPSSQLSQGPSQSRRTQLGPTGPHPTHAGMSLSPNTLSTPTSMGEAGKIPHTALKATPAPAGGASVVSGRGSGSSLGSAGPQPPSPSSSPSHHRSASRIPEVVGEGWLFSYPAERTLDEVLALLDVEPGAFKLLELSLTGTSLTDLKAAVNSCFETHASLDSPVAVWGAVSDRVAKILEKQVLVVVVYVTKAAMSQDAASMLIRVADCTWERVKGRCQGSIVILLPGFPRGQRLIFHGWKGKVRFDEHSLPTRYKPVNITEHFD